MKRKEGDTRSKGPQVGRKPCCTWSPAHPSKAAPWSLQWNVVMIRLGKSSNVTVYWWCTWQQLKNPELKHLEELWCKQKTRNKALARLLRFDCCSDPMQRKCFEGHRCCNQLQLDSDIIAVVYNTAYKYKVLWNVPLVMSNKYIYSGMFHHLDHKQSCIIVLSFISYIL